MPKYVFGYCGKVVANVWGSGAKVPCLSPAPLTFENYLGTNGGSYTTSTRLQTTMFSTSLRAILPPLLACLSPSSTGSINTTTKYISNIGVRS